MEIYYATYEICDTSEIFIAMVFMLTALSMIPQNYAHYMIWSTHIPQVASMAA